MIKDKNPFDMKEWVIEKKTRFIFHSKEVAETALKKLKVEDPVFEKYEFKKHCFPPLRVSET